MRCPGPCCMTADERVAWYAEREQREAKAQALLVSMLNETQCRTYARAGHIQVRGSHGTLYQIGTGIGYSGNVDWLDPNGHSGGNFCGHSDYDHDTNLMLPTADHHLAQMLSLIADEISWLNIAVRQNGAYPPAWHTAVNMP